MALAAFALFLSLVIGVVSTQPGFAQVPPQLIMGSGSDGEGEAESDSPPTTIEQAAELAKSTGTTVIVVNPDGSAVDPAAAAAAADPVVDRATAVRNRISEILEAAPTAPGQVVRALRNARGDGTFGWIVPAAILSIIAVAVGYLATRSFGRWGRSYFRYIYNPVPRDRAEKVSYTLVRTLLFLGGVVVFFVVSNTVIVIAAGEQTPARATATAVCAGVTWYLFAKALFFNLFMPDAPSHRLVPFDDETSARLYRSLMVLLALLIITFEVCRWIMNFAVSVNIHSLLLMFMAVLSAVMVIGYGVIYRRPVRAAIRGSSPNPALWRRLLGASWHVLLAIYVLAGTVYNIEAIALSGIPQAGVILAPSLALFAGFGIHGVLVILIDKRFRGRQRQQGTSEEAIEAVVAAAEGEGLDDTTFKGGDPDEIRRLKWATRWRHLFEKVAAILAAVFSVIMLLAMWGVFDLEAASTARRFVGVGIIILVCYVAYEAVKIWIDGKIEEEAPAAAPSESEDGMGPGSSRLATLLPIVRNLLLIVIAVIGAMVLLSGMGVDVGPLFAGAGVIGLAVGFGAQTLIRDMFSGAFFLLDDAFRRGEYIDVGGTMGAVEKISLRSFQLRHHNGPLHTIPFGEIKQLTNFSRDWVIMKLPIRLTYGTDVEKVRKLIKKLGVEMAADPDIGAMFLEPPKSQGVVHMEDSAMIIRVKFKTKPGDQFMVRRHVYQRVHDLFAENDIHFAHREVTVRVAGSEDDEVKKAAALGAARALDEQQKLATAAGPGS
ncbi:MAG: mechanosensitive ion channel family protein [Pseudomonadota bacterium]